MKMLIADKKYYYLSLYEYILMVLSVVILFVYFIGPSTGDSFWNIRKAYLINQGIHDTTANGYEQRLFLIYSVAVVQRLFGISYFSGAFLSMLGYISVILSTYKIGKLMYNERSGFIASIMVLTMPFVIELSTEALPDMFASGLLLPAFYLYVKNENENKKSVFIIIGILMGLAYFVREFTVFWIFLFFIYEIIFHRSLKRFLTILIGLIPIVLIGHLLYLILYHDFFYRYTSAFEKIFKANQFANFENFKTIKGIGATDKTNTFLYYTYTIFSKLGSVGFMPVTFLSLLIIKIRSNVHVHKKILFFILAFYILFEFILRYILPVPRVMNYIVFLYPLIALVLGGILVNVKFSHDSNLLRYVLSGLCILSAIILSAWISNGAYFQNMLVNQLGRYEYVQNLIFIQRVLIIISFVLCSVLFLFVRLKLQYIIPSIIVITNLLVFAPFHTFWALSRKYDMRDMYHDYLNAPMKSKIWVCMNYEGVRLEFLSNYNYHTDYPDFKPTTIGKNILHWNEHQPHLYHWDNGVHDWTKGDLLIADDKTVSEMNMRSILKSMKSYRTFSVWEIISDKPHL